MGEFRGTRISRPIRSRQVLVAGVLAFIGAAAVAQPQDKLDLTPQQRAEAHWQAGYLLHTYGEYERAIEAFRASIAARPTAEAHTFLGWSLSHLGKIKEAITECETAIKIDPDFGNPYNDIGVYLIDLGRAEEAVGWLEKAARAKRYCCYQFPHYNLGRVLLGQGKIEEATRAFQRALEHDPQYLPALMALLHIRQLGLKGL